MLKTLLKKQLTEIFRSYFYDAKKNRARSKTSIALYIVLYVFLMVGLLGGIFTFLARSICSALASAGVSWLYFAILGLLSIFLGVFGSVFNTYSGLYLGKDNDLLLSMPIPPKYILASRLLSVYLMGLMYSGVVSLPAVAVYWFSVRASAAALFGGIMFVLLISVFVLTFSCVLGWLVAKISLKLKNKSFITVIVSLLFFGVYYFFYFRAQTLISTLVENATVWGGKIKSGAYPIYVFGRAAEGDILPLVAVTAVAAVLFFTVAAVMSKSFLKLAAASGAESASKSKKVSFKGRSAKSALFFKELSRFTSSAAYMLNCGLGTLFLAVGGIAVLFKGADISSALCEIFEMNADSVCALFSALICTVASLNITAAPSVSLEGKTLWCLQSLPVNTFDVLKAKLNLQLVLTAVPALFCALCMAVGVKASPAASLFSALAVVAFTLFDAASGLALGLKMPNLTWTNEIVPIKQSGAVFISMILGWVYCVLFILPVIFFGRKNGAVFALAAAAILLALFAVVFVWLKKKGTKIFEGLTAG